MSQWTKEDINEFQMKDKRIITQSNLKALAGDKGIPLEGWEEYLKVAFKMTNKICKEYPMMEIPQTIKNQSQGQPF